MFAGDQWVSPQPTWEFAASAGQLQGSLHQLTDLRRGAGGGCIVEHRHTGILSARMLQQVVHSRQQQVCPLLQARTGEQLRANCQGKHGGLLQFTMISDQQQDCTTQA